MATAVFTVQSIIDGQTIEVSPNWKISNQTGNRVKISGYDVIGNNDLFAKNKLTTLLLQKMVELKNPVGAPNGNMIQCSVYLNDIDIAQYFPEFKTGIPT